jgi:DNA-binding PadR family transcriptional regulator
MDSADLTTLGILGVLAEDEAATVDRIQDRLQHSFGRYWTSSYGVLLPTLSRLTERTPPLVEADEGERDTAYRITERGRERFGELLREPIESVGDPMAYPAFVLKLGFLHHLPADDQRTELAALEDRFRQARDRYLDLEDRHESALEERRGYRRELLSLRAMVLDDHLQWIRRIRDGETVEARPLAE